LDDHTHALDLQLLATKDQALDAWRTLRAQWETMSGLRVNIFRSDNGREFINDLFTLNLEEAGIQHQHSAPYAPQQNGKAERVMCTIEGCMYAILDFSCLPAGLWGEAALTACYLFNWTESRALPMGKTPYEMMHGVQPNLTHLRIFGSRCFARIPPAMQEKLGPWSREAVFLGYPPGVKAWRCRDTASSAFFNSRDVIFDEGLSNRPFPDSDDDEDEPSAPPTVPALSSPIPASPPHTAVIRRSGCIPMPTEKGALFKGRISADKSHLAHQREVCLTRINSVAPSLSDSPL
jgi:hypothetical protein